MACGCASSPLTGLPARNTLRVARHALEVFDDAYGPYPWPELIVAPYAGGLIADRSPALVFMGVGNYARDDVARDQIAHDMVLRPAGQRPAA